MWQLWIQHGSREMIGFEWANRIGSIEKDFLIFAADFHWHSPSWIFAQVPSSALNTTTQRPKAQNIGKEMCLNLDFLKFIQISLNLFLNLFNHSKSKSQDLHRAMWTDVGGICSFDDAKRRVLFQAFLLPGLRAARGRLA